MKRLLENIYNSYRELADEIDWKKYNSNDLFFGYIEHENDSLRDNFYAALVCRYWGYTGRIYLQCNRHISFDQCYDILIDTLNYVLKKRVWENPESSIYQDKTGPDKAFHLVIKRQKAILLASLTTNKRKTNFNTLSIDEIHEDYRDSADGLFSLVETSEMFPKINDFIRSNRTSFEMVVLDKICFSEWRTIKSIVKQMKELDGVDYEYYRDNYDILQNDFNNLVNQVKEMSNRKLMSEIKKLLYSLKSELV